MFQSIQVYLKQEKEFIKQQAKLDKERQLAKSIQADMLSKRVNFDFPQGIYITSFLKSMHSIGGDFFDYGMVQNNIYFLIGDVSGKGVPASLLMSSVLSSFRTSLKYSMDVSEIMFNINQKVCNNNDSMMFISVFLAVFDINTGILTYVNAGHPSPVLVDMDSKEMKELSSDFDVVLGVDSHAFYRENRILFSSNSRLFMFTDGLTEVFNHDEQILGEDAYKSYIVDDSSDLDIVKDNIIKNWSAYSTHQFDDCTFLIFDYVKNDYKLNNPIVVEFKNDISELVKVNSVVNIFCMFYSLDQRFKNEFNLILEELITNIVYYAYENNDLRLIKLTIDYQDTFIACTIEDDGILFNPFEFESKVPDQAQDIANVNIGGIGLHLIKKLVSSYEYSRNNMTNTVKFIKEIL